MLHIHKCVANVCSVRKMDHGLCDMSARTEPQIITVCVALFYYTDIGESLRSRGQFLTAVDLGWPDPHPSP